MTWHNQPPPPLGRVWVLDVDAAERWMRRMFGDALDLNQFLSTLYYYEVETPLGWLTTDRYVIEEQP